MSRPTCLTACFFVSMACGTMYGFSSYAPQLSERLQLSARHISSVGMAGNMAMAMCGPLAGALVDRKGFLWPVLVSCFATFTGYMVIRVAFVNAISSLALLAAAQVALGFGATFAFSASIKCAAINFPDCRGLATSVAMSGYGLSAFVMSTLAKRWNAGAEGTLSVLTFVPTTLLILFGPVIVFNGPKPSKYVVGSDDDYIGLIELPRLVDRVVARESSLTDATMKSDIQEVTGKRLFRTPVFWCFVGLLGVIAGLGQSYIYTCGYMVKALAFSEDEHPAQARQVALLSLANCAGRLLAGSVSDLIHSKWGLSRTWSLLLAGSLCFLCQLDARSVTSLDRLWIPTVLAGLFYGAIFGCYPGIVADTFGVRHLSSNWGLVALAPIPFSYFLTLRVGTIYDAHAKDGVCLGTQCFRSAFSLHILLVAAWFGLLAFTLRRYSSS